MKPLVSLITPVFNAMPYLGDYLASAAAQEWRPLELIAVDDGSTDASADCLQTWIPAFRDAGIPLRILRREHQGAAAAVNAALPLVSGEYLTWCDADDWMPPDSIGKKAEYLRAHPALGMVRSDGLVINGDTGRVLAPSAREADRFTQKIFDALFRETTYCYAGCYMLRTALLFECYPEKRIPLSPVGQNLQLLLPPASCSDCGFLPETLHKYFLRAGGNSSRRHSFTQTLEKLDSLTRLRRELLPYCSCDRAHYLRENELLDQQHRQQLYRSAAAKAREEQRG